MMKSMDGTGDASPGGPLILIADPSAASRNVIADALAAGGYRTLCAESGNAALMMMRSEQPWLMLADRDLPGLSGLDLLREVRSGAGAQIPVILMASQPGAHDIITALNAGADDHVAKPLEPEVIRARVERQLERAREMAMLRKAAAALDARLTRRALEIEDMRTRIEELAIERQALLETLGGYEHGRTAARPVKSISAR